MRLRLSVNKTAVLGLIFISAVIAGWLDAGPLRGGQQEATLLGIHAVLAAILVFLWFYQDSVERGYRPSWFLRISILVLSVLALPWYFFRSRGVRGGAWALVWLAGAFVVAMLCYRIGTRLI